jgi:hypothetical protein
MSVYYNNRQTPQQGLLASCRQSNNIQAIDYKDVPMPSIGIYGPGCRIDSVVLANGPLFTAPTKRQGFRYFAG